MSDIMISNYSAARSSLVEVDVADEMANYTALDVQKQAAQAILTQANLSQRSLLKLYEFNYSS
jgi:flagellin-like hook-associated protein FlgL